MVVVVVAAAVVEVSVVWVALVVLMVRSLPRLSFFPVECDHLFRSAWVARFRSSTFSARRSLTSLARSSFSRVACSSSAVQKSFVPSLLASREFSAVASASSSSSRAIRSYKSDRSSLKF